MLYTLSRLLNRQYIVLRTVGQAHEEKKRFKVNTATGEWNLVDGESIPANTILEPIELFTLTPTEEQERMIKMPNTIESKKDEQAAYNGNFDPVDRPQHYNTGKIECIDAIEAATIGLEGFEGMLTGNAIKYLWRWKKKIKPVEDLKKAIWYIERLIKHYESADQYE